MRKLGAAVGAAVALGAAVLGQGMAAAPASAAAGDCPAGDWCLWYFNNYTSTRWQWSGTDLDYRNNGTANNNSWSAYNHGYAVAGLSDVLAYDGYNGSGAAVCFRRGVARPDLNAISAGAWRDRISGHRWTVC
jgi:hypothetical protein